MWHPGRVGFASALSAGLAVGMAGLTACGGAAEPPTEVAAPDTADQVLFGVEHNVTIEGVLRVKLFADTVYFYQGMQLADLIGVRVEFYAQDGALSSTVTSSEGTYLWRTRNMEARGDVVGESPDGRRLTTSVLRYERNFERISGPDAFVYDAPGQHIEGDGFTADPDLTDLRAVRPRRGRADIEVRR